VFGAGMWAIGSSYDQDLKMLALNGNENYNFSVIVDVSVFASKGHVEVTLIVVVIPECP
jgi:hypothetical protein